MRDNQRKAVYQWERSFPGWTFEGKLSLPECEAIIGLVWAEYRPHLKPPVVKDGRGTRTARGSSVYISLPKWSRSSIVVLHEVTHSLVPYDVHNPKFATLYTELLARYEGFDAAELRRQGREQKPRRVHFIPKTMIPAPYKSF